MNMASTRIRTDFDVEVSDRSLGYNLPQRLGRALWLPMLAMALMAFPAGAVLGAVRAHAIATGGSARAVAELGQFSVAANFVGFASVFAAISFAIARILGVFRVGGGRVQEAAGGPVQTLRMPGTARVFLGLMAMAMMTLLGAVALHVAIGASIAGDSAYALGHVAQWGFWLEGARRIGIAPVPARDHLRSGHDRHGDQVPVRSDRGARSRRVTGRVRAPARLSDRLPSQEGRPHRPPLLLRPVSAPVEGYPGRRYGDVSVLRREASGRVPVLSELRRVDR